MFTYLIIGLILVLVGVLVYSRRTRSSGDRAQGFAAAVAPAPAPAPASPTPPPAPVAVRDTVPAAAVQGPPPPSNWIPEETIVEPGWPLPGEISGSWSPVTTATGAAGAVRQEPLAATAVVERAAPAPEPRPEPAAPPVAEADEWVMPDSPQMTWPAPAVETLDPIAPAAAGGAESAATAWDPPVATMDTPVWTPPPVAAPSWPADESAPEAADAPLTEPAPPEPVVWNLDPPAPPPDPPPAPASEAEAAPAAPPPADEWVAPLAEAPPSIFVEPIAEVEEVVLAPAPPPSVEPVAETEPADLRDQSLAVADLATLLEGLVPLTRVSDRSGVTPRLMVLMRALAESPLSVSEQARRLDVSRPIVAELTARLEARGLARRERDAADRRRVRIALTERGRRVCEEGRVSDPSAIEAALVRMEPGERDGLIRGVRALERVAAAH